MNLYSLLILTKHTKNVKALLKTKLILFPSLTLSCKHCLQYTELYTTNTNHLRMRDQNLLQIRDTKLICVAISGLIIITFLKFVYNVDEDNLVFNIDILFLS